MRHFKKGFTLIELLIVIMVIAILGSVMIPRMLLQPGKAYVGEAKQMLGAIRRAQMRFADLGSGGYKSLPLWATDDAWEDLGLRRPVSDHFNFTCYKLFSSQPTSCRAQWSEVLPGGCGGAAASSWVEIDLETGDFICSGIAADGSGNCIV